MTAQIAANGTLSASLKETSTGQSAADERRLYRTLEPSRYSGALLRWVIEGTREARIENVRVADDDSTGMFGLLLDFKSAWYGRSLGGSVLMFKPVMSIPTQPAM